MDLFPKKKIIRRESADQSVFADEYAQLDAQLDRSVEIAAYGSGQPAFTTPAPAQVNTAPQQEQTAPAAEQRRTLSTDDQPAPAPAAQPVVREIATAPVVTDQEPAPAAEPQPQEAKEPAANAEKPAEAEKKEPAANAEKTIEAEKKEPEANADKPAEAEKKEPEANADKPGKEPANPNEKGFKKGKRMAEKFADKLTKQLLLDDASSAGGNHINSLKESIKDIEADLSLSKKERKKQKKQLIKLMKKERKSQKGKGRFITPLIVAAIVLSIILSCVWDVFYCMHNFEVNFYQVESTHVTSDVRIAVISDVHLSEYGEDNKELVDAVRAVKPDIIISAGDLVTYGQDNYDNMLSLCRQLAEIAPFYGVMGNHEDEKVFLANDTQLHKKFRETGMILLVNKVEKLRIQNNEIELVGVSGGTESYDLYGGKEAMDSLAPNSTALRICVAHVPTLFRDRLDEYDFDLGIAGHTHGGLIRLPVIGGLYSAEEGFNPDYDGGLFDLDNGATLFVSRGLGNSGKIPRFNNTPELAVIDIRWY